jgi:hypothetical protein
MPFTVDVVVPFATKKLFTPRVPQYSTLAVTRDLLEMYRRQLFNEKTRRCMGVESLRVFAFQANALISC